MPVQVFQCGGQRQADPDALIRRQPSSTIEVKLEGVRYVQIRISNAECRRNSEFRSSKRLIARRLLVTRAWGFFRISDFGFRVFCGIVRQFHHVIEISGLLIPSYVQDVHLAFMQTGNRLELLDAFKLPVVRPIVLEPVPVNHFNGPVVAQHVSRQPHLAVAAAADAAQQFVVWNGRCGVMKPRSKGMNGSAACV